jgi:2,4-dienoyl-CoA reductase-like NADH-dependent reductase (Old Yellow Enzyme family)
MPSLFSPYTFRTGAIAPNRIALAPMTNQQSHLDGTLGDDELHWLFSRADGGFGIVETCAAHVAKDGQSWPGELGVFDDAHVPGLARLARGLRSRGAFGLVQLFHGGLRAAPAVSGSQPWSASEFEGARAATEEDLARVIAQFAAAARRAEEAGFDGVELHGAHGYLLNQFLSRVYNTRTDRWGGDAEGRARLVREVVRAVRAATGPRFVLGVRLSPEDFGNARGMDLGESIDLARALAEDSVDFVHLSLWRAQSMTQSRPDAHAVDLFRAALPPAVGIFVAGSIWTPAEAEALLAHGADVVALGRSAIANPDWPLRAREPGWEPRRPPLSPIELRARALSPRFAEYMRGWKGFVSEG